MKIFKKILLSILCIVLLASTAFIGYRMILSEAKIDAIHNSDKESPYTCYIEYNGKKYYEQYLLDFPDNYYPEDIKEKRLTYCREISPWSFITFSIYGFENDGAINMLFRPNNGILGPSGGWVYICEDYVFPTVQNSEISYIELEFSSKESILFTDEEAITKIAGCIKKREDVSNILPVEEYGIYGLYVHYKDAPVYEHIGGIWGGKYMYEDEYWEWVESTK